jgi:thiosulfate dehydrogenase
MLRSRISLLLLLAAAAIAACAHNVRPVAQPSVSAFDPTALPTGPLGASIALGHAVIVDTQHVMPHNVTADMNCSACHLGGGTIPRGGSFVGVFGRFPQWNKRAMRVITLQDRIAECFLYSMNGRPPAFTSKAMTGVVAYIAYLSRDVPTGAPQPKSDGFIVPLPAASPDLAHGQALYMQKCSACHQASGAGVSGTFPPLWGPTSFNNGAGMAHIDRMTGFVMYNMPRDAPGTLSLQEAYDISGWVLSHPRPKFMRTRLIVQPAQPAKFF